MTLLLAEGLADSLITHFEANLDTKLTALETRYGDGLALPDMETWNITESQLDSVPKFPEGFVIVERGTTEPGGWQIDQLDGVWTTVIGVVVRDASKVNLRTLVNRYLLAITEVLMEAMGALDGWIIGASGPLEFDFSPVFVRDPQYLMDGALRLTFRRREAK